MPLNAGAIVVCDILVELLDDPKRDYLGFVRKLAGCETIEFDSSVAASESSCGYRNRSIINLMKSFGNIRCDIDEVLDLYFHACSIAMSCRELSRTFTVFANSGALVSSGESVLSPRRAKRINAVMAAHVAFDTTIASYAPNCFRRIRVSEQSTFWLNDPRAVRTGILRVNGRRHRQRMVTQKTLRNKSDHTLVIAAFWTSIAFRRYVSLDLNGSDENPMTDT